MSFNNISRRKFLEHSAVVAGALAPGLAAFAQAEAPATQPAVKRTATDIVELGKTGLKISRLGLGCGSGNGSVQTSQGAEGFNRLVKYAYDQGLTYFDTAQSYRTFNMIGAAIKGLPREKIFILSKIQRPENILTTIDNHRKTFNTDYVDSMLIHIQTRPNWTDTWKQAMDEFNTALERKWIHSRGVSCHSLPALRASVENDWTQVNLVRVNPQGVNIDNEQTVAFNNSTNDVKPVVDLIKKAAEKGRGVIGMKIFADGALRTPEEREKSLKFAMSIPEIHSLTIGFGTTDQIDQTIKVMNKVLAELDAA